jgi:hypothetical protein
MRSHCRWVLPVIGLMLFGMESYDSYRLNRQLAPSPHRYYWWSAIRLDSQPTKAVETSPSCQSGTEDCIFQPDFVWVDPGYASELLICSSLPGFAAEAAILAVGSRFGVSEVWTFMFTTPILVAGWFYFAGWLIDRWVQRRSLRSIRAPG